VKVDASCRPSGPAALRLRCIRSRSPVIGAPGATKGTSDQESRESADDRATDGDRTHGVEAAHVGRSDVL
jgi:hypothetical protein